MRTHFNERLQGLRTQVVSMGMSANDMVQKAVDSIVNADPSLANEVVKADDTLDRLERELLLETALIIAQEGPVASDLKLLVSTLGIVSEIESVADHAVKLARRGTKLGSLFPSELKGTLRELCDAAKLQFTSSLKLYMEYEADLARTIVADDDQIDGRYATARNGVLELIKADPANARAMLRTIEIFHALEHVADHAVAISKRMQVIHEQPAQPSDSEASSEGLS